MNKELRQETAERRKQLIELIKRNYPNKMGKVLLFANFEREAVPFSQESSFYYFTEITEPATVLCIDLETEKTTLFIPNFGKERGKWVADALEITEKQAHALDVDAVEYLGKQCQGYQCHPFFTHHEYEHLLKLITQWIQEGQSIFSLNPVNAHEYIEQRFILLRMMQIIPTFEKSLIDISKVVAQLRRKKSKKEIEQLFKAIEITVHAHESILHLMRPGITEQELHAAIEYTYIVSGCKPAFTSIVASGKNSTILHYIENKKTIVSGDLVVIDIGAQYNHYCADITRTYPASGTFTARQKEIYSLVLETQEYIAQLAKPGMWLSNKNHPEQSLNHLAKKYLEERGYGDYFVHGIGHFLGLDVHDVGDYAVPLEEGDVITIEPGIYIPEESLGVRIEDDYWIVPDGAICLSEYLPKLPEEIEEEIAAAQSETDRTQNEQSKNQREESIDESI